MNKDYATQNFLKEWQDTYDTKDIISALILGILLGAIGMAIAHVLLAIQIHG